MVQHQIYSFQDVQKVDVRPTRTAALETPAPIYKNKIAFVKSIVAGRYAGLRTRHYQKIAWER